MNETVSEKNKFDILHPRQIPTKMKTIRSYLFRQGIRAIRSLLKCLVSEPNSFQQKNHIIITAALFERISCLVYFGKDGYQKPSVEKYYKDIFEGFAETPEEVFYRVERFGVTEEKANHVFKLVWQVADLVCPMMSCVVEQAVVSEYAYAIEYVIRHNGDLPKPEISHLFPSNYPDYHHWEGIADEIRNYEFD